MTFRYFYFTRNSYHMKTLSIIVLALSFGYATASFAKNCQPHVCCHHGINSYGLNFLDTTIDSEAALFNPFYISSLGCDPMGGCTWGCYLDSLSCWFNGNKVGIN